MMHAGARCGTHADAPAVDVCTRCGRFLCGECVQLVDETAYCDACLARVNRPASGLAQASLGVAVLAWFSFLGPLLLARNALFALALLLLPIPTALLALVLALWERRRIKVGESAPRGRTWTLAALLTAAPLMLLMVALYAFWASRVGQP